MAHFLQKKIAPFDPSQVVTVEDALVAMQGCSFQARNLGNALELLTDMVRDEGCLRVLTLAGAMIPAGMEEVICQLVEKKVIGAIVSTGANIIHSLLNVMDPSPERQAHFVGSTNVDDRELNKHQIDRVYDTFLRESSYWTVEDALLARLRAEIGTGRPVTMTPSEFVAWLVKPLEGRSFVKVATDHGVPVFCGAFSDSELGLDVIRFRKFNDIQLFIDDIGDIDKFAAKIMAYERSGTIILGGGVPRNWAQQVFPYIQNIIERGKIKVDEGAKYNGYQYSVRFHSAVVHDGGLSGCTIAESISWGKYQHDARYVSVWGDSTVYFPLVATALLQRMARLGISC